MSAAAIVHLLRAHPRRRRPTPASLTPCCRVLHRASAIGVRANGPCLRGRLRGPLVIVVRGAARVGPWGTVVCWPSGCCVFNNQFLISCQHSTCAFSVATRLRPRPYLVCRVPPFYSPPHDGLASHSLTTHYTGVPARYILGIHSFTYSAFPAIPCIGQPLALVHSDALATVPCITLVAANRRDDAANLVVIGAIGHHLRAGRAVPGVVIRRRHVLRAHPSARPFHVCVVAIPPADR